MRASPKLIFKGRLFAALLVVGDRVHPILDMHMTCISGRAAPHTPATQGESLHCALLLDSVPPKEPLGTPLGNTLRIRRPKLDWRGP